jgi:hypothetical protein
MEHAVIHDSTRAAYLSRARAGFEINVDNLTYGKLLDAALDIGYLQKAASNIQ